MEQLRIGYAEVNINPPLGIGIDGYYVPRFAQGFLDDIEASALALSCKGKTLVMISVDNCGIDENTIDRFCNRIEAVTGIPAENLFISATHSHTAPLLAPTTFFNANDTIIAKYADFIEDRLCDVVTLALKDLKPGKMGYIVGYAPERVAYIRRYKMKDGTTWTCPPIEDPNIDYPLGTLDQRVNVLRFDRDGGCSVVLMNYGLHADTTNGDLLSSDWPGWTRKTVEKALDGTKCMFFAGAQGDVGSTNVHPTAGDMNDTEISFDNEMKSPGMARFVGRALAGTILQVYDKVHYLSVEDIDIQRLTIHVPSNMPKPEDMPRAKEYKALHDADRDDLIPYTAMELTTVVAEAIRMCRLEHGPETFPIRLTGIKLGSVGIVGIPGEPFTDIGVEIKKIPGWDLILPCALTNGSSGYFPTKAAYDEGGYEARTSPFRPGISQLIVDGAQTLLDSLK